VTPKQKLRLTRKYEALLKAFAAIPEQHKRNLYVQLGIESGLLPREQAAAPAEKPSIMARIRGAIGGSK